MAEQLVNKPAVVVLTGTHSSGKSTLMSDVELGKLSDIDTPDPEYDDFGYGLVKADGGLHPYVTVPESARRLANLYYHHPDSLAENYTLDFQLNVESDALFRIHSATEMATQLTGKFIEGGVISPAQPEVTPIVISDRGPLDGIIYSKLLIPGEDMDVVGGSPRTGFMSEWLKSFVNLVVITDFKDVPFEADEARLEDAQFRQLVGENIESGYRQFLDEGSVVVISGNREERRCKLEELLGQISNYNTIPARPSEPYKNWRSIELDISAR
jgi:hypothetical protein